MGIANELGIFPKRNVRIITYPSSLQKLADFGGTLAYLLQIIPLRKLPTQNSKPVFVDYSTLKLFRRLCYDVCKEFADNNESGVSKNHKEQYVVCHKGVRDCIKLFEENSDIMDFDMSDLSFLGNGDDDYFFENKKNWYRLVYDTLVIYERSFSELLSAISPSEMKALKPLPHFVIAAIYYYNDAPLTKTNMGIVAAEYNWTKPTSGQQILEHYNKVNGDAYRLGKDSKRSNTQRIKQLIEAARHLKGEALKKCEADIQSAKAVKKEI